METQIRMALVYSNMSQKDIAEKLGMSRPSFNAKLKRDTWTVEELRAMACAIGCSFKAYFEFPDGKQV